MHGSRKKTVTDDDAERSRKCKMGIYLGETDDIRKALLQSRQAGFDYLCANMVSDEYRTNFMKGLESEYEGKFSWFNLHLQKDEWRESVIGVLSDGNSITESTDKKLRDRACNLVERELQYTPHLSMRTSLVNLPPGDSDNLCRVINSNLKSKLWVRLPVLWKQDPHEALTEEERSSWKDWNRVRFGMDCQGRVQPVLDLPQELLSDPEELRRWLGEPVKAVCLSDFHFRINSQGFPRMLRDVEEVVGDFMGIGAEVIINCAPGKCPDDYVDHKLCVEFVFNKRKAVWEKDPCVEDQDKIQGIPLQPSEDKAESAKYEMFENDPVKYELYENALVQALLSKVPEEEKDSKVVVCMIVGAGRGPIIRNCLSAAETAERQVKIYAVEKNRNALSSLRHLNHLIWKDQVNVLSSEKEMMEKADIIISELMGSLGDNELSPEYLEEAQTFLKDDGIMIPQSYTGFISPVMTPKLHYYVRKLQDKNKHEYGHFETLYTVHMKNFYEIAKPKALFHFQHPKLDNSNNDRFVTLNFKAKVDCVMDGFVGYFESILFGDVRMSIRPDTRSEGMISWYPVFLPVAQPIFLKKGDKIKVQFWRCSNKHAVWYEWKVEMARGIVTHTHNINGRSYKMALDF